MIPRPAPTAVPTIKARHIGEEQQRDVKRITHLDEPGDLSAESTSSTPPLCIGLFATTPITWPDSRAKPVTISLAHSAWISKNESLLTSPRT